MFGDILYNLIISPLEMIIELIFSVAYKVSNNPGLSIIAVSLVVNFLALPLYRRADKIQSAERDKQAEMKPWLDHIKKAFKGDKRYMMTQTYYRQQNYKPIYALKSSISLLLQIPFFMAAYHFLSHLTLLSQSSFWIFDNLGAPDGLIPFGPISLNLLPLLMTAINFVSSTIYTRGFPKKDKIQLYAMALIFLVLLYDSPSGLVFYWTLNNLFSLCKTIILKYVHIKHKEEKPCTVLDKRIFFAINTVLTVMLGLYIPLMVVSASPDEFIGTGYGPMWLVINTFTIMAGFFMIWLSVFYYLGSNKVKNIFIYIVWGLLGIGAVNYFIVRNDYGNMANTLIYDDGVNNIYFAPEKLLNLAICALVAAAFIFIIKKWPKVVKTVCLAITLAGVGISVFYSVRVQQAVNKVNIDTSFAGQKIIPLSKTGQNVIVLMLDRAISWYVPDILDESPEVAEALSGFVYYPNSVSFGKKTNFSTPSLFGGYEYTPAEINKRDTELLSDKHNEALSVLPSIFNDDDYDVTVIDPPYAGSYTWIPDLGIYDRYENVNAYYAASGVYNDVIDSKFTKQLQEHNFVYYSVFCCSPIALKCYIYDEGNYMSTVNKESKIYSAFMDSFSTLVNLVNITDTQARGDTLLLMQNSATHEPTQLNEDYMPEVGLSTQYDPKAYYQTNKAVWLQLKKWFDYMKENEVWDNTRIIICSDHGELLYDHGDEWSIEGEMSVEYVNALLMVKDFNATGFSTCDDFMTLADIPALATAGVIENPTNPFTGNPINMDAKKEGATVTSSMNWNTSTNNGTTFDTSDGIWMHVNDNIFDMNNWTVLGETLE